MELSNVLQEAVEYVEAMEHKIEDQAETIEKQAQQLAMQEEIVSLADELAIKVACYRNRYPDEDTQRAIEEIEAKREQPVPQPVQEQPEAAKRSSGRRFTDEDVVQWHLCAQEGWTHQEIADEWNTTVKTVKARLEKYEATVAEEEDRRVATQVAEQAEEPEAAPEPAPDPILAAIEAYGQPEPEMVDRWEAALKRGLTIAHIAGNFHANPKTVEAALQARKLVCSCGAVIGRENPGVLKGRDGVCGYCLQERLGIKAASAII
jgi:uncharacterized protein (DUF433 family)